MGRSITDKKGVTWEIICGDNDADEENYGVFDGKCLIAHLSINRLSRAPDDDCPVPYWSVGMIEVTNPFQGQGIGPRLLDAIFDRHGQPLASDLDQDGGGADLWKRWIRNHPGKIELYGPEGSRGTVVDTCGAYSPNPWADRNTRLVRKP